MAASTTSSADPGFQLLYRHKHQIDQLMQNAVTYDGTRPVSYSDAVLDRIILTEEIYNPYMKGLKSQGGAPDLPWDTIYAAIAKKYGMPYAGRVVGDTRPQWYTRQIDWYTKNRNKDSLEKYQALLCQSTAELFRDFGAEISAVSLNNKSWELFLHCSDRQQLEIAIGWMAAQVRRQEQPTLKVPGWVRANDMDTYANLLYKTGQTDEATRWEEAALTLAKTDKDAAHKIPEYEETIAKMKQGLPTWPQD